MSLCAFCSLPVVTDPVLTEDGAIVHAACERPYVEAKQTEAATKPTRRDRPKKRA